MPPKQRQLKKNEKSPAKATAASDTTAPAEAVKDVQGAQQPAAPPSSSSFTLLLIAFSFLVRSLAVPYFGTFVVTGMLSRWSGYPSAYTATGVTCAVEALDGPKFCEHEIIFEEQGVALLSCDPGRGEWNTVMGPLSDPNPRGKLWLFDYANSKQSKEIELKGFPIDTDFHPLGMTLYKDATKTSLFVINHQRTGPSIEAFTIDPVQGMSLGSVNYQNSIEAHSDIRSANSIVALDHEHFYVTNDHAWPRLEHGDLWATVETYTATMYPQTFITHIDNSGPTPKFTRAFKGLPFVNGLASGSNGTIYSASSVAGSVSIFQPVNATNPVLVRLDEIFFGYSLDNVHVSHGVTPELDTIVVAGHPNTLALTRKAKDPHSSKKSPSWISFARRRQPQESARAAKPDGWHEPRYSARWETRTVYEDDGSKFSSITGAGVDMKRDVLVAPGLYETGVLVCRGIRNVL